MQIELHIGVGYVQRTNTRLNGSEPHVAILFAAIRQCRPQRQEAEVSAQRQ